MAEFTLQEIIDATGGTCKGDVSLQFKDISTDTRTIQSGYVFVALRGDTFDGHDFINAAIEKGATAAIVENGRAVEGIVCVEVENTLKAYQDLANYHRRRFQIPVVAITGSSGKTTTKEMVAAVLGTEFNVLKTEKNFNNEIGLPKTLLQLTSEHEACVVEMGMRGLGQIEELALIAEPTIGIITNVGTSHIELLGSQEAIAEAKGELIRCLGPDSVAILNEDDHFVKAMSSIAKGCKCYDEVFDVFLPMIGEHNVYDALAAIGAGRVLGVKSSKIKKGLSEFTGTPMRQEIVAFDDIVILNDAYNANPSSMSEAIKALGQLEGKRKIAMLGDMLELGDFTEEGHRQVGRLLAEEGYSVVFTFGDAANFIAKEAKLAGLEVHRCNSHLEMANAYNDIREKGDVILVKGSRGLRMERVVEELKERE